jgi:hypothetical protein
VVYLDKETLAAQSLLLQAILLVALVAAVLELLG